MKYDFIVVGAGSSGAIIASRLSENPSISVLLLEGGPDYPDFKKLPDDIKFGYSTGTYIAVGPEHDWGYIAKVNGYESGGLSRYIRTPRGKITGGTSSINGQIFLRGLSHDFELWKSLGLTDWSYEEVLPYFRKLETDLDFSGDFHGEDGPIIAHRFPRSQWSRSQKGFFESAINLGYRETRDMNYPDASGVGPFPCNNPNGIRISTAVGHLSQARYRLNLTVSPNSTVNKIILDKQKVSSLEVESGGDTYLVHGENVVLCAGAIANPKILMLSGIGPTAHLEKMGIPTQVDLPGIGQNLSDHPINFVKASVKDIDDLDTQKPCLQVGLRYTASESDIEDDMLMWMNSYSLSTDYREVETISTQGNLHNQDVDGIQIAVSVYFATSKGRIQLNSIDPKDSPDLFLNLLDTDKDVERMAEGIRIAKDLMESKPMRPLIQNITSPTNYILNSRESFHNWLRTNTVTGHHLTGTCRMGSDTDDMSVVDSNGKIKGLSNLYIADASIMPESVRANTNATTMMIGEKISAHLETNH